MGEVWKKHSYDIVKMFVNQIAIAVFGFGLAIATGVAGNKTLQIVSSVGAIIFYLFLIYALCWEIGAKDGVSIKCGKMKRNIFKGLYMSLFANIPNAILAILCLLGTVAPSVFGGVGGVSATIALVGEGMYTGVLSLHVAGNPLNSYAWAYFVIMLPALITSFVAYLLGSYDIHLTNILIVKNPELARSKQIEKAQEKERKRAEKNSK